MMRTLFSAQRVLKALAPEHKWTYGGNLVGDFGEFLAVHNYELELAARGSEGHDAIDKKGNTVQIKTSHVSSQIGFRGTADLMLVIGINDDEGWHEVYFGPFDTVVQASRFSAPDNKRMIAKSKLAKLNRSS